MQTGRREVLKLFIFRIMSRNELIVKKQENLRQ